MSKELLEKLIPEGQIMTFKEAAKLVDINYGQVESVVCGMLSPEEINEVMFDAPGG